MSDAGFFDIRCTRKGRRRISPAIIWTNEHSERVARQTFARVKDENPDRAFELVRRTSSGDHVIS